MDMLKKSVALLAASALLGGCGAQMQSSRILPAVNVAASVETAPVGTSNADAADDPAIWRNPSDPAGSLVVGTDKKAGLYVYGLDGKVRDFLAAGQLNNVDLVDAASGALVVASDRGDPLQSQFALFELSPDGKLSALGKIASGLGEAYGLCLQKHGTSETGEVTAYAAIKDGTVREFRLTAKGADNWAGQLVRSWKLPTQIEGCVTNPRNGDLFIGEENVGIWRIRTGQENPQPELYVAIGEADGLVADVEGLAIALQEDAPDYLIASSQGDNAYALFDLATGGLVGRFRISAGDVDGTSETDGIEILTGDLPGFAGGIFVAQDGDNSPEAQNFKFVSWTEIKQAVGIK
jgi:3-phytase